MLLTAVFVAMVCGLIGISDDAEAAMSGDVGTLHYEINASTGVMTITGSGEIPHFDPDEDDLPPWYGEREIITSVEINDGVTKIGRYAFNNCTAVVTIRIPATIVGQELYTSAFEGCTNLERFTGGGGSYPVGLEDVGGPQDGILYWVSPGSNRYIDLCPCNYQCAGGVLNIDLSKVDSVDDYALKGCRNIQAFSVSNETSGSYLSVDSYGALLNHSGTIIIKYPTGRTNEEYTIPDTVVSYEHFPFGEQYDSTFVFDSPYLKKIYAGSNPYYSDIDGVLFSSDGTTLVKYPSGKTGAYTVPDNVTKIFDRAFYGVQGLTSIDLNDVTYIDMMAFEESSVSSITFPAGGVELSYFSFGECMNLRQLEIPSNVILGRDGYTNAGVFTLCGLQSVIFLEGTGDMSIGVGAFGYCTELTTVVLSSNVKTIEDLAFAGCASLRTITIPDTVTSISDSAFAMCSALSGISMGCGLTSVGSGVFAGDVPAMITFSSGTSAVSTSDIFSGTAIEFRDKSGAVTTDVWGHTYKAMNPAEPAVLTQIDGSTEAAQGNKADITAPIDASKFMKVAVDGVVLTADKYTVSSTGNIVVEFKGSFTRTLSVGEHPVMIYTQDGNMNGILVITEGSGGSDDSTGGFAIPLWIFIVIAAAEAALIVALIAIKNKKQ